MSFLEGWASHMNILVPFQVGGMMLTAVADAFQAETIDFDEKCANVDNIRDAIDEFNQYATYMSTKQEQILGNLGGNIELLKNTNQLLCMNMAQTKERQERNLKREKVISAIMTSIIAFMFVLKVYLPKLSKLL
jgi:TolA-binding protein